MPCSSSNQSRSSVHDRFWQRERCPPGRAKATTDFLSAAARARLEATSRLLLPEAEGQNGAKISSIRIWACRIAAAQYSLSETLDSPRRRSVYSPGRSMWPRETKQQFTPEGGPQASPTRPVLFFRDGGTITDRGVCSRQVGLRGTFAVTASRLPTRVIPQGTRVRVHGAAGGRQSFLPYRKRTAGFAGDRRPGRPSAE